MASTVPTSTYLEKMYKLDSDVDIYTLTFNLQKYDSPEMYSHFMRSDIQRTIKYKRKNSEVNDFIKKVLSGNSTDTTYTSFYRLTKDNRDVGISKKKSYNNISKQTPTKKAEIQKHRSESEKAQVARVVSQSLEQLDESAIKHIELDRVDGINARQALQKNIKKNSVSTQSMDSEVKQSEFTTTGTNTDTLIHDESDDDDVFLEALKKTQIDDYQLDPEVSYFSASGDDFPVAQYDSDYDSADGGENLLGEDDDTDWAQLADLLQEVQTPLVNTRKQLKNDQFQKKKNRFAKKPSDSETIADDKKKKLADHFNTMEKFYKTSSKALKEMQEKFGKYETMINEERFKSASRYFDEDILPGMADVAALQQKYWDELKDVERIDASIKENERYDDLHRKYADFSAQRSDLMDKQKELQKMYNDKLRIKAQEESEKVRQRQEEMTNLRISKENEEREAAEAKGNEEREAAEAKQKDEREAAEAKQKEKREAAEAKRILQETQERQALEAVMERDRALEEDIRKSEEDQRKAKQEEEDRVVNEAIKAQNVRLNIAAKKKAEEISTHTFDLYGAATSLELDFVKRIGEASIRLTKMKEKQTKFHHFVDFKTRVAQMNTLLNNFATNSVQVAETHREFVALIEELKREVQNIRVLMGNKDYEDIVRMNNPFWDDEFTEKTQLIVTHLDLMDSTYETFRRIYRETVKLNYDLAERKKEVNNSKKTELQQKQELNKERNDFKEQLLEEQRENIERSRRLDSLKQQEAVRKQVPANFDYDKAKFLYTIYMDNKENDADTIEKFYQRFQKKIVKINQRDITHLAESINSFYSVDRIRPDTDAQDDIKGYLTNITLSQVKNPPINPNTNPLPKQITKPNLSVQTNFPQEISKPKLSVPPPTPDFSKREVQKNVPPTPRSFTTRTIPANHNLDIVSDNEDALEYGEEEEEEQAFIEEEESDSETPITQVVYNNNNDSDGDSKLQIYDDLLAMQSIKDKPKVKSAVLKIQEKRQNGEQLTAIPEGANATAYLYKILTESKRMKPSPITLTLKNQNRLKSRMLIAFFNDEH